MKLSEFKGQVVAAREAIRKRGGVWSRDDAAALASEPLATYRDGDVYNPVQKKDQNARESETVRGQVYWQATDKPFNFCATANTRSSAAPELANPVAQIVRLAASGSLEFLYIRIYN